MSTTNTSPEKVARAACRIAKSTLPQYARQYSSQKYSRPQLFGCLVLKIFSIFFIACIISFTGCTSEDSDQVQEGESATPRIVFSIEDEEYFKIPLTKVVKYTIREGECLFWDFGEQEEDTNSVADKYNLTASVTYWLNKKMLQNEEEYPGEHPIVNVLQGPFDLEINPHNIDLIVSDLVCYQINYSVIKGGSHDLILQKLKTSQLILNGNTLDRTVIATISEACQFPLDFGDGNSNTPILSVVPEEITIAPLFQSTSNSEFILEVSNSDYALLSSVLKANKSRVLFRGE